MTGREIFPTRDINLPCAQAAIIVAGKEAIEFTFFHLPSPKYREGISSAVMADVATAPVDGGADKKKVVETKPEKPDEATYKENLAKAEKEHQASMKKLVC